MVPRGGEEEGCPPLHMLGRSLVTDVPSGYSAAGAAVDLTDGLTAVSAGPAAGRWLCGGFPVVVHAVLVS